MSQASQRVSKLSRRAGRSSRPPPALAARPGLPDLDTSDDFTPSLALARSGVQSILSQSSCAAEPSSSQSQQLSGDISNALPATSVSFCGVLDSIVPKPSNGDKQQSNGVQQLSKNDQQSASGVQQLFSGAQQPSSGDQLPSDVATRPKKTRQATRGAARDSRSSRSTRQSVPAAAAAPADSPPPQTSSENSVPAPAKVDLSRFAWTAPSCSATPKSANSSTTDSTAPKLANSSTAASTASASEEVNCADGSLSPAVPESPSTVPTPASVAPTVLAPVATVAAVADCPVCLQPQPSATARTAHLKLCAERRGLSPAQLLAAVRLQQRQAGERAAAGLPATRALPPAARRNRTGQQGRRRGTAAAPASGDADLQMALAVSASLRDEEERTRRLAESQLLELGMGDEVQAAREGGAGVVPPQPTNSAPLPSSDAAPAGRSRGRGGRRKQPFTTVLLTQTREERERRLCEKVAQLLAWEEEVPVEKRRLRARKEPALAWEKAAQLHTAEGDYYVPELAGLVERCTAPVTSLLRDVADIPGRESLTQKAVIGDPGSGSDTEDPADGTQAALLLLAADCNTQPSQPRPANTGDTSVSAGDSSRTPGAPAGDEEAPADGTALRPERQGRTGGGSASQSSEADSVDTGTNREVTVESNGGGTGVAPPLNVECSRTNRDAGDAVESPSKRAETVVSPSVPSDAEGEGDMDTSEHVDPAPADRASDIEDRFSSRSPPTGKPDDERSRDVRSGPEHVVCDGDTGPPLDRNGDSSRPLPEPSLAAAQSATIPEDDGGMTGSQPPSETSTPRLIPSTPDSESRCSPGPRSPAAAAIESSPIISASPDVSQGSGSGAGSRTTPAGRVRADSGPCFSADPEPGDLGAALLDLLLTGGGPPTASLVCSDGPVVVHAVVLAVRCPPLYTALSASGGRLSLPEVNRRAAAALVRLLYLGETACAADGASLPQLLLLAERFGLPQLARHLRQDHGVVEPAAGPAGSPSPATAPLSPELFDLTASDGAEEMELESPAENARRSGQRGSLRRDSGSVVCSPGQSPQRADGQMDTGSPPKQAASAVRAGKAPRHGASDNPTTAGDMVPSPEVRIASPVVERLQGGGGDVNAAPYTSRRGRKRPVSTPHRPGSSDDICEVFSSLPKRQRTVSSSTEPRRTSSSTSQEVCPASPTIRQPRPASLAPREVELGSQEPRPGSADSDIQILEEVPVVFTQRLKSPRRSTGRLPRRSVSRGGDKSPVVVSEEIPGGSDQSGRSEASPTKTLSEATEVREQSPIEEVSLLSSPALSQPQPRGQSGLAGDSFESSPLISRRREPGDRSQEQPSATGSGTCQPGTSQAGSPAPSRLLTSTPSDPVPDRNVSPVSTEPYSPEVPVMSPLHSPKPVSPVPSPSPHHRQRSASRASPSSPGDQRRPTPPPASPAGIPSSRHSSGNSPDGPTASSLPSSPPPVEAASPPVDAASSPADAASLAADVWEGFEDGGYIELMEPPPPPLGTPLRPPAGASSSTPTAAPAETRSSLDSSELWQNSSLLAGYATPTAAEGRTESRRTEDETPGVRATDAGTPRAQTTDTGTPRVQPDDSAASSVQPAESEKPGVDSRGANTPGVHPEDDRTPGGAGTPDAGPAPPQQTPVNPYRVVLRASHTPRPNYVLMLTPELKRELARIGVKPISRRKAVALLSHIYEETHPPASAGNTASTRSETAPSTSTTSACSGTTPSTSTASTRSGTATSTSTASTRSGTATSTSTASTRSGTASSTSTASAGSGTAPSTSTTSTRSGTAPSTSTAGRRAAASVSSSSAASSRCGPAVQSAPRRLPSGDSAVPPPPSGDSSSGGRSDGDERFVRPREPVPSAAREPRSRSDSDSESSGSEGAAARLEEVFGKLEERLEREEEEEITPSQAACAASLPETLRSYIQSRPELYHQVLTYEPLWLESLHRDLRQTGLRLSVAQLMDFLDEQCITFRTENSGRRRKSPKKKKSPKKGSPKKRGRPQKKPPQNKIG